MKTVKLENYFIGIMNQAEKYTDHKFREKEDEITIDKLLETIETLTTEVIHQHGQIRDLKEEAEKVSIKPDYYDDYNIVREYIENL